MSTASTRSQKDHLALAAHDILCDTGLDFRVFVPVMRENIKVIVSSGYGLQ